MAARRTSRLVVAVATLAMAVSTGCAAIPADPEGTLERASGGVLRVGTSANPPWTALDLVIGGLTEKSPWADRAALTRPCVVVTSSSGSPEPHAMASRMGENALLVALERFLEQQETEVAERMDGERP